MAKVGAQRAAELTGKSKSTIQRAMNSGKLSYETDANQRRIVDVSELERVFGLSSPASTSAAPAASVEAELKKATDMIELERMKMKIKMLEDQLEQKEQNLDDMKSQRDQWQKQAQQVLITSQNHGFAADESSLPDTLRVTHKSLFDGSLQGIHRTDKPAFSFQGHPEASPGPHDAAPLFDHFIELIAARAGE